MASAPERLFVHVERSLDNGIREGTVVEVRQGRGYWPAEITMVCGHLLRVRFFGSVATVWCDMTEVDVHSSGWCVENGAELRAPDGEATLEEYASYPRRRPTVPENVLNERGLSALDKIVAGMKVELQSKRNPFKYWYATILENVGGRLLLQYDAPEMIKNDFWMFYTSPRIQYVGFTSDRGSPFKLQYPRDEVYSKYDLLQWAKCINASLDSDKTNPYPRSLIVNNTLPPHNFEVGMKLEAVDPLNMIDIRPATIEKVFDDFYFLVIIDDISCHNKQSFWLCDSSHPYIFPVGWSKKKKINLCTSHSRQDTFDWQKYLDCTLSLRAPADGFQIVPDAKMMGFKTGMKLEVADPLNPTNICPGEIRRIVDHLLFIYVETTGNFHWFSHNSTEIFPTGWCESNNIQLCEPKTQKEGNGENAYKKILENTNLPPQIKEQWCDRIYFNYKCYSGPLISKNKLSQLPKYVGPGPLTLVIREVLNMMISVAYKPARLLKDWEYEGRPPADVKVELLKAKLKSSTHHANVKVVSNCNEIPSFCKEMCAKLQACPFLFGPTEITDQCPEQCSAINKSKFRKKRRRRGLHFMTIRARERRAALEASEKDGAESANESEPSPPSTPHQSESGTRPNSPDSNSDLTNKKQIKKRITRSNVPPLEMKTRGAKLPNFALQMKEGHWNRKDVETIYNNTCVVPKKQYSDDSESDDNSNNSNDSNNSLDTKNIEELEKISDVSDSEEPELKKLRVTPPYELTNKSSSLSDNSSSFQSLSNGEINSHFPLDPSQWSIQNVHDYLLKDKNCREIARRLKDEEVDGAAFLMLNLHTMCEHLKMKYAPALSLCKHVGILKWLFFSQKQNSVISS